MNIIEATKALQDNKKVKRKEWGIEIFLVSNTFLFKSTQLYNLDLDDVLAEDWEVVE